MNPEIARPLEAICLKAMALKPEDRYASPKALADDIEHWLADEPVTAYREPLPTHAARWARKHKVLVAGLFGLVTAAAISLAAAAALIQRALVSESAARGKAQRQLALSYIDRGVKELERGEPRQGLAILGQAYRAANAAKSPELRHSACTLLGAWQGICAHNLLPAGATAVAFSPDGAKLATGSLDHSARLWDATTGEPLGRPMMHGGTVNVLAFSPDGTRLATAAGNLALAMSGELRLWDAATCQPVGEPMVQLGVVTALAFSPDGTKVATAEALGMVGRHRSGEHRLWDVVTGKQLGPAADHESELSGLAFSPDGTKVATASTNVARLWDAATGQPVGRAMKHDGALTALAFSPGGRKLATAGDDTTARLWDAATGQPAGLPMKHDSKVSFVVFSADGAKIATLSGEGARLWDATTGKPLGHSAAACRQGRDRGLQSRRHETRDGRRRRCATLGCGNGSTARSADETRPRREGGGLQPGRDATCNAL